MIKFNSIFLVLLLVSFNVLSQMKNQVVEVVLYQVNSDADKSFIVEGVSQELTDFEGFISRKTFQSFKDENLLLDWVIWESLEQAKEAAQVLPQKESLAPFMQSINKVEYFEHFEMKYFAGSLESFEETNTLELVLYKIKSETLDDFEAIFEQVSGELAQVEGFIGRQSGQSFQEENQFVDFLIWEDLAKAEASMAVVEQNPNILPFFEMNQETTLFEHFKIL